MNRFIPILMSFVLSICVIHAMDRSQLESKLKSLETQITQLRKERDNAKRIGDTQRYRLLGQQIRRLQSEQTKTDKQLKALSTEPIQVPPTGGPPLPLRPTRTAPPLPVRPVTETRQDVVSLAKEIGQLRDQILNATKQQQLPMEEIAAIEDAVFAGIQ